MCFNVLKFLHLLRRFSETFQVHAAYVEKFLMELVLKDRYHKQAICQCREDKGKVEVLFSYHGINDRCVTCFTFTSFPLTPH